MRILSIVLSILATLPVFGTKTADQTWKEALGKLSSSSGLSVTFSFSGAGQSGAGSLKAAGNRFAWQTPQASAWFDGKTLWQLNKSADEVTVSSPSATEAAECNPLAILTSQASAYKAVYAKNQSKGRSVIVLTPKASGGSLKRAVVVLDAASLSPEKLTVVMADGDRFEITIKSLKKGLSLKSADFVYPASTYPRVQVLDLR